MADGRLVLVTLPCPGLGVRAEKLGEGPLFVDGEMPDPAPLLRALGLPERGRFRVRSDMPPGGGAGASTASLLALARAAGSRAGPEALAAACLAAEGAVDPLMLESPGAWLWAPREARALEPLPPPPPATVVGGFWGPAERTDPADLRFPDIGDLLGPWRAACASGDLVAASAIASASAARCTAMRGPASDPAADLAARLGALGWARAHTGPARALLFAPGAAPDGAEDTLRRAGLSGVLRFETAPGQKAP